MNSPIIFKALQIAILPFLLGIQKSIAQPGCQVFNSQSRVSVALNDEFYKTIAVQSSCPQNIDTLTVLLNRSFENRKFLVANRGRNNPKMGSFSVFESFSTKNRAADAGIFLGHFTQLKAENGKPVIDLDQTPEKGKLVIELIAWDSVKGYYNFYELIGQGSFNQWFYRGDSKDILFDNQSIYLNSSPQKPPIGQTLRCSGCHVSGGPIMKELTFPHNDWWIKNRPLIFGSKLSDSFLQRIRNLDSAENLSVLVQAGIQKLENSHPYQKVKKSLGIQAQLRPLFCDLEINIESDTSPSDSNNAVQIPSSALAGPYLGPFKFLVSKSTYAGQLQKYKMQFPETSLMDADHGWLAPVKGYSDLIAIAKIKSQGLVDDKTILDIYFSAPIGSMMNKERCELLKLVPNSFNWKTGFLQSLRSQRSSVARNLYQKMTDSDLTTAAYQSAMSQWFQQTTQTLSQGNVDTLFKQLLLNRQSIFDSEISKNPRGQILEPGFRVIFPHRR